MKRLLICAILFIALTGQVAADHTPDNPLDAQFSAWKVKWAVQIDGTYPELQSDPGQDTVQLSKGLYDDHYTFEFDVSKPETITESYLYIFTKGYDCDCEEWLVKFNDNQIASGHTNSLGPNPKGDGDGGFRQTLKFDVTSYVVDGTNEVYIKGLTWQGKNSFYTIDGVVLVTFYQDIREHEYWLYEGVEYLERNLVPDPSSYSEELSVGTYPEGANGTLYVIYHDNEKDDSLYFNDNFLNDSNGTHLLGTENSTFLTIVRHDVTDYLTGEDVINFSYPMNVPIFPSLFILDVDLSDQTPPAVTFTAPSNNTVFPSNTTVSINFTVDDPEASVILEIDSSEVSPSNPSPDEWSYSWNLTDVAWQLHNITAYGTDSSGNTGLATIFINVTKPTPRVTIIAPTNGSILGKKDNITIEVLVDDPNTIVSIEIDGEEVANTSTYIWDSASTTVGIHTVTAYARDIYDQEDSDTITVNITAGEVPVTSPPPTTPPPETTPPPPPPTTPPPETTPPVTEPPLPKVDLAINSLTLSTGSTNIKRGTDITVYILASNAGDTDVDATVALYSGSELLESKIFSLKGYDSKRAEFSVKGSELESGIHTLKAKILVQGLNVEERNPDNNERALDIVVEEASDMFGLLKTVLKWAAAIVIVLVVARIIINFISGGSVDYLR
jgi:hypothetical protein